jgi:hypothetical protein
MKPATARASLVASVLEYGRQYRETFLRSCDRDRLTDNWWTALGFFYDRAFYQGRRDIVSRRVHDEAITVLDPIFTSDTDGTIRAAEETREWAGLRDELQRRIGRGKVGKARDIEMTISALEYVGRLPQINIVRFSLEQVNKGAIEEHFSELQRSRNPKGIVQVGPKIAALYLRDLVSLYELRDKVPQQFQFCLQPVDVWVRKLAAKTGIVAENEADSRIAKAIVDLCADHNCSALEFNQGAWYLGAHAFELLVERLGTSA